MKNEIEMQRLQLSEEHPIFDDEMFFKTSLANMSLPNILIEDATEMTAKPKTDNEGMREPRSHFTTLRRQSKFTKGAERPKVNNLKGSGSSRQNQPRVSWQDLSQTLHKNLSAGSPRNVLTNGKEEVRSRQGERITMKHSESDVDSGVWSGRSCNDDMDYRRRRKSYQSWSSPRHNNILENSLQRFSSYSHLSFG